MEKGLYNFGNLITSRRSFEVPEYQRHYAWDDKQWEDLWNDLYYLENGKTHYFGTIILMEKGAVREGILGLNEAFERFQIVDGQQRIATALILLREIITQLERSGGLPEDRVGRLKEDYLKYGSIYKLEPLGDDKEFFRRYIIEAESPIEIRTLSQDRLKRAREFFKKKLEEVKTKLSPEEFKEFLVQFKQKMDKMEVMVYPIERTTEAARMFELVNDRGKILTDLEKTKSYLMYMVYLTAPEKEQERYLRDLNDCFGNMFKVIMEIQNSRYGADIKEDDVQRYHFIIYATKDVLPGPPFSEYMWTRLEAAPQYMRILKDYIMRMYRTDKKKCLDIVLYYAKDLEKAFFALKSILQYDENDDLADYLERMFLLGRAANFYPLLIACWIRFKEENEKLRRILRLIEMMIFRVYAIGRRRADTGRSRLYDLAHEVNKELIDYDDLVNELRKLIHEYEWNWRFENHLKAGDFYDRVSGRDMRYLLYEYESYLRKFVGEPLEFTLSEILSRDEWGKPNYEIEHIWPRDTAMLGLTEEELKEHAEYVNRLGNLTLAAKGWNSSMGNKPFNAKRGKYKESLFRVQRDLVLYEEWGKKKIEERERKLVEFALDRWKI